MSKTRVVRPGGGIGRSRSSAGGSSLVLKLGDACNIQMDLKEFMIALVFSRARSNISFSFIFQDALCVFVDGLSTFALRSSR